MTDRSRSTRARSRARLGLLLFLAVLVVVGLTWLTRGRPLLSDSAGALASDDVVGVEREPWLTFSPTQVGPKVGFVFYPGGRVAHDGYAPLMKAIASAGYLVVVPDMPLNIAAFRPNIADKIIAAHPDIDRWVIGGHSVGGAMAAQYAHGHSHSIDGLVIWASYPPDRADLSDVDLPVTLIYGSLEMRVTDEAVAERRHLLPEETVYVRIEGGDHHQFGSYEVPPGDRVAVISRAVQHEQIIRATLELLGSVSTAD